MIHFDEKDIYHNTSFPYPYSPILKLNSFYIMKEDFEKYSVTFLQTVFLVAIHMERRD